MSDVQAELRLEREALEEGWQRYSSQSQRAKRRLSLPLVEELVQEVRRAIEARWTRRPGGPCSYRVVIDDLGSQKLALLAVQALLEAVSRPGDDGEREPSIQEVGRRIAERCRMHHLLLKLSLTEFSVLPDGRQAKRKVRAKMRVLSRTCRYDPNDPSDPYLRLGLELLAAAQSCEMIEIAWCPGPDGPARRKVRVVRLKKRLTKLLAEGTRGFVPLAAPVYRPMVIPPLPWQDTRNGGYILHDLELVKHWGNSEVKRGLATAQLSRVTGAVNWLQGTPWRINKKILEKMKEMQDKQAARFVGLPAVPELPKNPDQQQKRRHYLAERERDCFLTALDQRLSLAEHLKGKTLYFPYQLDFRGRAYPVPQTFNPQSDDVGRALLKFAIGQPLGASGRKWLAIHLANLHGEDGVDKKPFPEREKWVQKNLKRIKSCTQRPLEEDFWQKADKPWRFLAACYEWVRHDRRGFKSHQPIAMDGTCNGFQHLSALAGDAETAKLTNLISTGGRQDLYEEVAAMVRSYVATEHDKRIPEQVAGRMKDALGELQAEIEDPVCDHIAERLIEKLRIEVNRAKKGCEFWSCNNRITRKVVKKPTMSTPYGVTSHRITQQLFEDGFATKWDEAVYLAPILVWCIAQNAKKSSGIMLGLQALASALAKEGHPIRWVNPVGFPVILAKHRQHKVPQEIKGLGRVTFYKDELELDPRKQRQGVVATLVHSLDSAHMMLTVLNLRRIGLKYCAMVHDSYAVHACDVDTLRDALRGIFVKMHMKDRLREFYEAQREGCTSDSQVAGLPPTPQRDASFDLEKVRASEYLFC